MKLTLLQTVGAIAARKNPAQGMDNWILVLGDATRAAVAAGYLRNHHGFTDDWGGFKVTPAGHAFLKAHRETPLIEAPSLPSTPMDPIQTLLKAEADFLRVYGWTTQEEEKITWWVDPKNGDRHSTLWSALAQQKLRVDYP